MIGRRIAVLVVGVCLISTCLPLPQAGPGTVQAAKVNAGAQVTMGCSSSPGGPYLAGCAGLTLGMTVHLAAATTHQLGVEYQLWITCRRVEPLPVVGCGRNESTSSPFLLNAHVRNAKSFSHNVTYDFQAWLVYHPSGTPIVIKRSNIVRVSWAHKAQVVTLRRVRTVGRIVTVVVHLAHGSFEPEQYLDLRIINGPGRFTTIGLCPSPLTTSPPPTSCTVDVNCARYRAQIEVQGRVVNGSGEVTATSEPLFLCRAPRAPHPKPKPTGLATWTQIQTPCTPTSDDPNKKLAGNACYSTGDPTWKVGPSSASHTTPGFYAKFQYSVPQTIPPGGATVKLSAQEKNDAVPIGVGSDSDFSVKDPANRSVTTPGKDANVESQASVTVTIESFKASKGSTAKLVIGLGWGEIVLTYTYRAN